MAQDLQTVEKIEYGGVKETMLSEVTLAMFGEFNDLFKVFTDSSYDPLDLTDDVSDPYDVTKIRHYILKSLFLLQSFPKDYENFKTAIVDMDKRLAALVLQGYDDCSGLQSIFRVRSSSALYFLHSH